MPRHLRLPTAIRLVLSLSLLTPVVLPAVAQTTKPAISPSISKDSAPERRPGDKPVPGSLEAGIWTEFAKAEHQAKTSGERNHDPALDAYVDSVMSKVAGPFDDDIRLYVMDRPFFNASVAANGYSEVWSGLLLRCQTESEMAFILGHEAGHFRHSHSLRRYQELKNGQNAALVAALVISIAGAAAQYNAGSYQAARDIGTLTSGLIDIAYLGIVAAVMGYSRETEHHADAHGVTYMHAAGYDLRAGETIWRNQIEETAASDIEKVRRSQARINVFGSHPLDAERLVVLSRHVKTLQGADASAPSEDEAKAARAAYRQQVRPFLSAWLKDDLRRQDYGQTIHIVNRLLIDNEDAGVLNFYKGEAYRLRVKTDDLAQALGAYREALGYPDAPQATWRQIGDVHRRMGNLAQAAEAYEAYVAQAPDAEDAWMVQDQIDTIRKTTPAAASEAAPSTSGGT